MDQVAFLIEHWATEGTNDVQSANEIYFQIVEDENLGFMTLAYLGSHDPSKSQVVVASGILKSWQRLHWNKLEFEVKQRYLEELGGVLRSNIVSSSSIASVIVDLIKLAEEMRNILEQTCYSLLQSVIQFINDHERLYAYFQVICSILRPYRQIRPPEHFEPSLFMTKFLELRPYFFDSGFICRSQSSFEVIRLYMKCMKHIYERCQPPFEALSSFLDFASYIVSVFINDENSVNSKFAAFCASYEAHFMYKRSLKQLVKERKPQFLQLLVSACEKSCKLGSEAAYALSVFLQCIKLFKRELPNDTSVLDIFIEAARIDESDLQDYESNPALFFSGVYDRTKELKGHPRAGARSLITDMIAEYPECAAHMLMHEHEEAIARCLSISVSLYEEHEMTKEMLKWAVGFLHVSRSSPVLMSTAYDMLCKLSKYLEFEDVIHFVECIPSVLSSGDTIASINACRFMKKALAFNIPPTSGTIEPLLQFITVCPTPDAELLLQKIAEIYPDSVVPYAESVITAAFEALEAQFPDYINDPDDEDLETSIIAHFSMMKGLIVASGGHVVCKPMVSIIAQVFQIEDGTLFDAVGELALAITQTGSPLATDILTDFFTHAEHNSILVTHISSFVDFFIYFASNRTADFVSVSGTSHIIAVCQNLLLTKEATHFIKDVGDIMAWTLAADVSYSASDEYELMSEIISSPDFNEVYKIIAAYILVAIAYPRSIQPTVDLLEVVLAYAAKGYFTRASEKILVGCYLLNSAAQGVDPLASTSMGLMCLETAIQQKDASRDEIEKKMSELEIPMDLMISLKEYKFPLPIDAVDIMDIVTRCLSQFDEGTIEIFKRDYPSLFVKQQ